MASDALNKFLQRYNRPNHRQPSRNITQEQWETYGNECIAGLYKQYFNNTQAYNGIRPSNAYKPAITHVLQKFGYCLPQNVIKWNRAYAPFIGHVTEAMFKLLLIECNVPFTADVHADILNGAMRGTADLVIDDMVIDVKSMNANYYRSFTEEPDDSRGYITQLHLYAQGLGLPNMAVMALCKDYPSAALVRIAFNQDCLDSVTRRIDHINAAQDVTYILNTPVPALVAGYKGTLNVPPQLMYCETKSLLYELTDETSEFCKTAVRARTPSEVLQLLTYQSVPDDEYIMLGIDV